MLNFYEGNGDEETKAKTKGSAVHCLLLEPNQFDKRYAVQPEDWGDLTKNAEGKPRWDAFKKENAGKACLTFKDVGSFLVKLKAKVRNHIPLRYLLAIGRPEVSIFVQDVFGVHTKIRVDLLTSDTMWDVKTSTEGMTNEEIYKTIKRYKYDFSAAYYMRVGNIALNNTIKNFGWIFVDTSSPALHIRLVTCPISLLQSADERVISSLTKIAQCQRDNVWPGYIDEIEELKIPRWAKEY